MVTIATEISDIQNSKRLNISRATYTLLQILQSDFRVFEDLKSEIIYVFYILLSNIGDSFACYNDQKHFSPW